MTATACSACNDDALSALAGALADDDLDRAIELGVLAFEAPSAWCDGCRARIDVVIAARDTRLRALAARERHRTRQVRLTERAEAKARKRAEASPVQASPERAAPALPSAALAALARAKAKAAAKRSD